MAEHLPSLEKEEPKRDLTIRQEVAAQEVVPKEVLQRAQAVSLEEESREVSLTEQEILDRLRTSRSIELVERKIEGKEAVIFDFDGTLVDALPVFLEILNSLADKFGYTKVAADEIPELRMKGYREFIQKRLNIPRWKFWKLTRLVVEGRKEYQKRIDTVKLFPEIKDALERLRRGGYKIGIISSSSTEFISELLEREGIRVDFIYSSDISGKAKAIRRVLKKEKLDPKSIVYIGDETRDVEACKKARVDSIAASWGFNAREALEEAGANEIVDQLEELLEKLMVKSEA